MTSLETVIPADVRSAATKHTSQVRLRPRLGDERPGDRQHHRADPYPGTETWLTEARRLTTLDYRLYDVQHAVLPTRLPLHRFYTELVKTQSVLARKHLGGSRWAKTTGIAARHLAHGQTNFIN